MQDLPENIDVVVDTDFAGCLETRKSTSGGIIMLGNHCLRTWSSTQTVIALSSGEAELYGISKGASMGIGFTSIIKDMGFDLKINIHTDSSAAIGITKRSGLGKVRHIQVQELWIQAAAKSGKFTVSKIPGIEHV